LPKTPLKKAPFYTINYTLALSITVTKALLASLASLFRRRLGFLREFWAKSHLLGGLGIALPHGRPRTIDMEIPGYEPLEYSLSLAAQGTVRSRSWWDGNGCGMPGILCLPRIVL
jgi:hypothetical protein